MATYTFKKNVFWYFWYYVHFWRENSGLSVFTVQTMTAKWLNFCTPKFTSGMFFFCLFFGLLLRWMTEAIHGAVPPNAFFIGAWSDRCLALVYSHLNGVSSSSQSMCVPHAKYFEKHEGYLVCSLMESAAGDWTCSSQKLYIRCAQVKCWWTFLSRTFLLDHCC